jgi:hypothetical protein
MFCCTSQPRVVPAGFPRPIPPLLRTSCYRKVYGGTSLIQDELHTVKVQFPKALRSTCCFVTERTIPSTAHDRRPSPSIYTGTTFVRCATKGYLGSRESSNQISWEDEECLGRPSTAGTSLPLPRMTLKGGTLFLLHGLPQR